ncbi:MAG: protein-export chaperone SecB [Rickettsiales bacterium]|nr:protein-export chaperone SecB [Rickettsiales bacterium]
MKSKKTGATITLNNQYIKDLSFENPKAPEVYTYKNITPNVGVSIDLNATKLQNEVFESEIVINIEAKTEDKTLFIIELVYAGIFTIKDVGDDLIQENLFIDCPTLIFPFARGIIAETIMKAGFPPVMMDMIDFEELYNSKKGSIQKQ